MADTPRLKVKYQTEIVPALVEQLGIKNINCVPKLEKIVVNMGVGAAAGDSKLLDAAMNDMRIITGQQPCVTRAKKSIAGFHAVSYTHLDVYKRQGSPDLQYGRRR